MAIPCSERVLKSTLTKNIRSQFTVIEFCKEAQIKRGMFYNHYQNMSDLLLSVVVLQLKRSLRSFRGETMRQMFYRVLIKIQENKIFYINMLLIAKEPRQFCMVLTKELALAIENYMRPRGAFSVRKINLVAIGVYSIIYNWVVQECVSDVRDIYQSINLLLQNIEQVPKN
ncbi:hypothetical protein OZY43_05810 [Lactobacillus sp. ESL0785]|uniref:hypothetical protein n=1 Tax=Lactobacillus sp. ESL0785 TaxID=2983232 RepID=UPI0023F7BB83|nr:hypothetical protein [Lactobacillus sp. ESL0785]WEV70458.1 hypothetical protein OZY43_05810 [Lactobacillus sp. ESL0785]